MPEDFAKRTHLEWLGYTQPVGVVVSATALVEAGVALPTNLIELSQAFEKTNPSFRNVAVEFLGWRETDLQPPPESMTTSVSGYDDVMYPTYVVPDLMLVQELTEEKTAADLGQARPISRRCGTCMIRWIGRFWMRMDGPISGSFATSFRSSTKKTMTTMRAIRGGFGQEHVGIDGLMGFMTKCWRGCSL